MAAPKKRKADDETASQDATISTTTNLKKTQKPKRAFKRRKKVTRSTENFLMKLPAELRNIIYDLVLVKPAYTITQPGTSKAGKKGAKKGTQRASVNLLRVSKAIRSEASPVYYLKNSFNILLYTSEIDRRCRWLIHKDSLCGSKRLVGSTLCLTSGDWKTIESWKPLAKLAYELDHGSDDDKYERQFWKERILPWYHGNHEHFVSKLIEVAVLGAKARQWGLTYEELDAEFEDWMRSTMSSMRIGKRNFGL